MTPFEKAVSWFGALCLGIGALAGSCATSIMSEDKPEPETKTVTKTVTKTKEIEVEVPTLPESCRLAIDRADKVAGFSSDLSSTSYQQLDLLEDAAIGIATKDIQLYNQLIQEQRDLIEASRVWLTPLIENDSTLQDFFKSCQEDLE
jgi:hypothetical protein